MIRDPKSDTRRSAPILAALLGGVAMFGAAGAAASAADQAPARVEITEVGPVFATSSGMTLYTWAADAATPGISKCTNAHYQIQSEANYGNFPLPAPATRKTCAEKWPPFLASADAKATGDWSLIHRPDGAMQWAFQGRPLYASAKDHRPGDVNGEPVNVRDRAGWHVAKAPLDFPPGFKLVRLPEGLVLATEDGRPAYVRRGGRIQRTSSASTELLQPIAAPGLGHVTGKWSIVDGAAGSRQYAFDGEALYVLPVGLSETDIKEAGWTSAIFRRAAPLPPQIHTRPTILGHIYTAADGKSLYVLSCAELGAPDALPCDDPGDAAVYWSALCGAPAECSRRWRPYLAPANARPSGEWTIEEVSDPPFLDAAGATYPPGTPRVKAWAYRGKPLYTFVDDDVPGETLGHAIQYWNRSAFTVVNTPGEYRDN